MKVLKLLIASSLTLSLSAFADLGWYQDYVFIDVENTNPAGDQFWFGDDPGFATSFDGHDFGEVSTLELVGFDLKYWSDTQDRIGAALYYRVDAQPFTELIVDLPHTHLGGNDYQGTSTLGVPVDLTSGLAPGPHTVEIYAKSWSGGSGQGDSFLSAGGANYSASFSTIPEPSSFALLGLGLLGVSRLMKR